MALDIDEKLQLARLHIRLCELDKAKSLLDDVLSNCLTSGDWDNYLECVPLLLRIHAENLDFDQIVDVKERLADLVIRYGLKLNGRIFYSMGICSAYRDKAKEAGDYFERALKEFSTESKDRGLALNGWALAQLHQGFFNEALKTLKEVESLCSHISDTIDLIISVKMTESIIYRNQRNFEKSLDVLKEVDELFKLQPCLYTQLGILYAKGSVHLELSHFDLARFYFESAWNLVSSKNIPRWSQQIQQKLSSLSEVTGANYDLLIDRLDGASVIEKSIGKVDFRNQFLLFELLHFLARDPGKIYSKSKIVEKVWQQPYNSDQHDNKLYVTIKRLRRMIEPEIDKPSYVLRKKGGYCLSPHKKVYIKEN